MNNMYLEENHRKPKIFVRSVLSLLIGDGGFSKLAFKCKKENKGMTAKKKIADPINPETEVTREGIAKLAECSIFKVGFVTMRDKWGFPKPVRPGQKGIQLYSLAAVLAWLENNELKNMVFTAEDRAPIKTYKKAEAAIDSTAVAALPIGIKRQLFKGTGKSYRIRVEANHGYEAPDPRLTRFSNSGAEHRYVGGVFNEN